MFKGQIFHAYFRAISGRTDRALNGSAFTSIDTYESFFEGQNFLRVNSTPANIISAKLFFCKAAIIQAGSFAQDRKPCMQVLQVTSMRSVVSIYWNLFYAEPCFYSEGCTCIEYSSHALGWHRQKSACKFLPCCVFTYLLYELCDIFFTRVQRANVKFSALNV